METISDLQYITPQPDGELFFKQVESVCLAGIEWLQLRVKGLDHLRWLDIALRTKQICDEYKVTFIINDNVEIAKAVNAHGVHLGKKDMLPIEARKMLGDKIIGGTANTFEDIVFLSKQGVDYIGLGPFRFTTTKDNLSPIIGIDGYNEILKKCREKGITTPIVAIGGIEVVDVASIKGTGVHGIAVSGLISRSDNKKDAVQQIREQLNAKP